MAAGNPVKVVDPNQMQERFERLKEQMLTLRHSLKAMATNSPEAEATQHVGKSPAKSSDGPSVFEFDPNKLKMISKLRRQHHQGNQ